MRPAPTKNARAHSGGTAVSSRSSPINHSNTLFHRQTIHCATWSSVGRRLSGPIAGPARHGSAVAPARALLRLVAKAAARRRCRVSLSSSSTRKSSSALTALANAPPPSAPATQRRASVTSAPSAPQHANRRTICCSRGGSMPKTARHVHSLPAAAAPPPASPYRRPSDAASSRFTTARLRPDMVADGSVAPPDGPADATGGAQQQ
mmetsp:Transcript_858/g.2612  ORF Transcript_858/g.2612 Transcript_858/m.2612 type:complete len:206 (-) Transcript_858:689-1306(-)